MHPFTQRKIELKELAQRIREAKGNRKNANYAAAVEARDLGFEYRLGHIAYCMARGREYEDIELKVRPENRINSYLMEKIIAGRNGLISDARAHEEIWQERRQAAAS